MPTKRKRVEVLLDEKEFKAVKLMAKPLTAANYFRQLVGLPTLKRGAVKREKVRGSK